MKKLEDYTNKELSLLTDEEVTNLIDIECMRAGVPLSITPKPILKEVPTIKNPTTEIYMVDNYYFMDKEEADSLADLLTSIKSRVTTDYNYNAGGSDYKYYKEYNTVTNVKNTLCYSKEEYIDLQNVLKLKNDIENYNKESINNYNKSMSERNEIVNIVWNAIRNAQDEMRKINEALNIYKKYIELSDGNEEIAQNFFKQNNKISEYFDIVIEEYNA